jgi:glutathione S-transferase
MPKARLWPEDRNARAVARAVSAEMHAGFVALRTHMPMTVRAAKPGHCRTPEVRRTSAGWSLCGKTAAPASEGGPFLFGRYSDVDAPELRIN